MKMFAKPTSLFKIEHIIIEHKPKLSTTGFDDIPSKRLKSSQDIVSVALSHTFNCSLNAKKFF